MKTALWGKGAARCMVLAMAAFAGTAQAQDPGALNGFRLPPAPSASGAPAEGPVDSEHPVATPTSPTQPSPTPQPAASETPRIILPTVTASDRLRERPQAEERRFEPVAIPSPTPLPTEADETIEPSPVETTPAEAASSSAAEPQAARADTGSGWGLPLLLGLIALVTIGLFYWLLSRPDKRAQVDSYEPVRPAAAEPEPSAPAALPPLAREAPRPIAPPPVMPVAAPEPEPLAAPEPLTPAAPVAQATPAPEATPSPLALRFAPRNLQVSLVYATLAYQLELTNNGEAPLTGLRVFADMISAHASQTSGQQLSMAEAAIERTHEVASLAPGETAKLRGKLVLPLAEVLPVRAGKAELFVPLARFLAEADGVPDASHIYSLGLRSDRAQSGMAAFRLDLGPQLFRDVMEREVDVARWLPINGTRKAG